MLSICRVCRCSKCCCIFVGENNDNVEEDDAEDFWQILSPSDNNNLLPQVNHDTISDQVKSTTTKSATVISKTSTGCGPSPPREIISNQIENLTHTSPQTQAKKMTTSTSTSPPPQSISTQVNI